MPNSIDFYKGIFLFLFLIQYYVIPVRIIVPCCKVLINLPIRIKICRSILFLFSGKQNVCLKSWAHLGIFARLCRPDLESNVIENHALKL